MSSTSVLRSTDLLQAREAHVIRLKALYDGQAIEAPLFLQGIGAQGEADPYQEPERWVTEGLQSLAEQAEKLRDSRVFRPLCLEFGFYGVHFVDRMFGARVFQHEGQWWADTLRTRVGQLHRPDLDRDDTWTLSQRLAETFLKSGTTAPLFGLPTIASPLNIAVNLYGEEFLVALITQPQGALHDLQVINDLLCELHQWYRDRIPAPQLQPVVAAGRCQPPGFGQLCGCTTHLLSAALYRDFVAPLDDQLLSVYPHGGMIHLCGVHTQHIPTWRDMRSLRALQLNDRASDDLATYFRELREDQIIYLNPYPGMTIKRALEITGGRRLVIVAEPPE